MYMEQKVLPAFRTTIDQMKELLAMKDAQTHGQKFIGNYIDPGMITSRGEVYDYFKKVRDFADMNITLNGERMQSAERMHAENMYTLARGIMWAVEHDGFDLIKHMPVEKWGYDIATATEG